MRLKTITVSKTKIEKQNNVTHIENEATIFVAPVKVKTHYYFLTKEN